MALLGAEIPKCQETHSVLSRRLMTRDCLLVPRRSRWRKPGASYAHAALFLRSEIFAPTTVGAFSHCGPIAPQGIGCCFARVCRNVQPLKRRMHQSPKPLLSLRPGSGGEPEAQSQSSARCITKSR